MTRPNMLILWYLWNLLYHLTLVVA
jgi:hypothetical protein